MHFYFLLTYGEMRPTLTKFYREWQVSEYLEILVSLCFEKFIFLTFIIFEILKSLYPTFKNLNKMIIH